MNLSQQLDALEEQRLAAIDQEKVDRAAAFLHTNRHPLTENLAGFKALPLNLFHCNLLQMIGSPFLPPFATPTESDLIAFLWIVSPEFTPGESAIKNKFIARCRKFHPPAEQYYNWQWLHQLRQKKAALAMYEFTRTVIAARDFVKSSLNDRPPGREKKLGDEPDYYSEFGTITGLLMEHFGFDYETIQFLPLKVVYQFLKMVHEKSAAGTGEKALLWNGSDRFIDDQLALLNVQKN